MSYYVFSPPGNITHFMISMEEKKGDIISHDDLTITAPGVSLVSGKVGNAVSLSGNGEFVNLGNQRESCMGNVEMCNNGLMITFYVLLNQVVDGAHLLSSGTYSIFTRDRRIVARFSTPNKTWEVSSGVTVAPSAWHRVEVSWDEDKGLQLYVDKEKAVSTTEFRAHPPPRVTDHFVYVGRPSDDEVSGKYADALIDQLEFWFSNRDHVKAFGLLADGEYLI